MAAGDPDEEARGAVVAVVGAHDLEPGLGRRAVVPRRAGIAALGGQLERRPKGVAVAREERGADRRCVRLDPDDHGIGPGVDRGAGDPEPASAPRVRSALTRSWTRSSSAESTSRGEAGIRPGAAPGQRLRWPSPARRPSGRPAHPRALVDVRARGVGVISPGPERRSQVFLRLARRPTSAASAGSRGTPHLVDAKPRFPNVAATNARSARNPSFARNATAASTSSRSRRGPTPGAALETGATAAATIRAPRSTAKRAGALRVLDRSNPRLPCCSGHGAPQAAMRRITSDTGGTGPLLPP